MTRKKLCLIGGAGFLLAVMLFTGLFLLLLQKDPSALTNEAAAASGPMSFQALSSGDIYGLLAVVVFLALFFYFVLKS